jgi:Alw26I/Eco31I/Esp3I family type II restriction m6 adenine DNA methyltransferase
MKKSEAEKLVNDTFTQPYDEDRFRLLVHNLFHDYERMNEQAAAGRYIPESFRNAIVSYKRLAKFNDPEGMEIDVLAVKLPSRRTLENARTTQRNFIARHLNGSRGGTLKDAALVAFYADDCDDWRFSLVRMDYEIDEEKQKVVKKLTPARRYSFLVGPNEGTHTACQQLSPVLQGQTQTTLAALESAFNIETVTKEFFGQYKALYLRLKDALDKHLEKDPITKTEFATRHIATPDFAKRLLGQIVFLYFLQKKGWLGVDKGKAWGTGPKNFMQKLYTEGKYDNFFNDVLEHLFYDALATERQTQDHFYAPLGCKIPFLNGGLFEPFKGYAWDNTDILLDNTIFAEIFEIFDLYNFTVREDEPLDKEVAVDPEMLGKVFENLIPENERKGSGTYYTPREIVHYMCQESLINYLDAKLNIESRPIQNQGQQALFSETVRTDLLTNYTDVYAPRVPRDDLAAFIYHGDAAQENDTNAARKRADNPEYKGKAKPNLPPKIGQYAKEIDTALHTVKICDPAIGSGAFPVGVMNEIVRARGALNAYLGEVERTPYDFKRHAIQESLYGVDIEPSAVDIAKLRLWLSLVVDEEDFGTIKPLPNLEYKIVAGDSLTPKITQKDLGYKGWLDELMILQKNIFNEYSHSKRDAIRKRVDTLLGNLFQGHNDAFCFNYWIQFHDVMNSGGFDIVIANPPYGLLNKKQNKHESIVLSDEKLKFLKEYFEFEPTNHRMINIFQLFVVRGITLLKNKGIFCQIYPLSFTGDISLYKLRKHIVENHDLIGIEAFPERDNPNKRVFENVKMSVCITMLRKSQIQENFFLRINSDKFVDTIEKKSLFSKDEIKKIDKFYYTIPLLLSKEKNLVSKIYDNSIILSDCGNCYTGEIDLTLCKKFLTGNSDDLPMLKGANLDRYIIKSKMSQGEVQFVKKEYLNEISSNKLEHYKNERIVMQGITGVNEKIRLKMTIADSNIFCGNSVNYIYFYNSDLDINAVLAIMNSKLLNYLFKKFSTNSNVNGYEVNNLPLPKNLNKKQDELSSLTRKLICINKSNISDENNIKNIESKIDQLVYQLYGLTAEEIAIVEGAVGA